MRLSLRLATGLSLLAACGCTYTIARLDYEGHPELRAVRYWTGKHDMKVPAIGPVEADEGGWLDCDAMVTRATLKLLDDARRMGGNGVAATRYENPFHMAGRPRCRRNWVLLGHMTVRASGLAVPELPAAEAQVP